MRFSIYHDLVPALHFQIFFMGGFNRWSHKTQIGPMEMTPPDIPAQYDAYGNEVVPGIVRSGSTAHWKVC
jgi:hypothetical protein